MGKPLYNTSSYFFGYISFLLFIILYYDAKIVIIFELANKKNYFFYIFYF